MPCRVKKIRSVFRFGKKLPSGEPDGNPREAMQTV